MKKLKDLIKTIRKSREASVIAVGILAYITAICTLPSSGIWTSLPVAFLLSYLAAYVCASRVVIYAMMTVLPLTLNLLFGFELRHATVAAAYGLVSSFLAVLAKRALYTAKVSRQKKNGGIYTKSVTVLAVSVVAGAAVWLVCFGNPVSAVVAKGNNTAYVKENYGDAVRCGYTYHFFGEGYVTEITFEQAENGKAYYISGGRDDYYQFVAERLYVEASDYFERQTTIDADGVKCYIDGKRLGITPDSDYMEYLDEYEYFVEISQIVTDADSFRRVYENVSDFTDMSDTFRYKSVTVCAKDAEGNSYYAYKQYGGQPEFITGDENFENIISLKF